MLQLSNIPRPGMLPQQMRCFGRDALHRNIRLPGQGCEEILGQREDVIGAVLQQRQFQGKDIQSIVQIFLETASL